MDGRRFGKWWLSACLAAGALGCNRNAVQPPLTQQIQPAQSSGSGLARSPWGGSRAQPAGAVEAAADTAKKGPPKPETTVALADVQLAAAFDEKTPQADREGLLDAARQGYQKALQQDPKNKAAMLGV